MKKYLAFTAFLLPLIFSPKVFAVCPVCTVAVGVGLGLSRWLGIDDSVSGVWVGGLIISSGLWFASWLRKKNVKLPYIEIISVIAFAVLTIVPLYFSKIIGHPLNTILGVDKLLVGGIGGLVAFFLGTFLDKKLREKHDGKGYFNYQKIVFPVSALIILSLIFYFLTK